MIVNITAPDSGSISLFGHKIDAKTAGSHRLPAGRTRALPAHAHCRPIAVLRGTEELSRQGVEAKIDEWLARVKLSEWKNKRSMELSKGMQQKIQFITSVIHDPDLLILDEPFSGLDPINVELLKEIVLDLKRAGKTIIFSTHQMEVAEKICDDICLLNRSQKVF